MEKIVDIKSFRNIKYFEEELSDVFNYLSNFIKSHSEKENTIFYESIICHKIDRLCFGIPNFLLSFDVMKMVKEIYSKIIEIKKDNSIKNMKKTIIDEIYDRFKYLIEWTLFYYEETFENI